jgi:hypothetical protein
MDYKKLYEEVMESNRKMMDYKQLYEEAMENNRRMIDYLSDVSIRKCNTCDGFVNMEMDEGHSCTAVDYDVYCIDCLQQHYEKCILCGECDFCNSHINIDPKYSEGFKCNTLDIYVCTDCKSKHDEKCSKCIDNKELCECNLYESYVYTDIEHDEKCSDCPKEAIVTLYLNGKYPLYLLQVNNNYVLTQSEFGITCIGKDLKHDGTIVELTEEEYKDPSFPYIYKYKKLSEEDE